MRLNEDGQDERGKTHARLLHTIVDDARTVLAALAQRPGTWLTYEDLADEANVRKLGGALRSISIQSDILQMSQPIERRRNTTLRKLEYSMPASISARIIRITEG